MIRATCVREKGKNLRKHHTLLQTVLEFAKQANLISVHDYYSL